MDWEALRAELEAHFRAEFEGIRAHLRAEEEISDDEYVARVRRKAAEFGPPLGDLMAAEGEEILKRRLARRERLADDALYEKLARAKTEQAWPFLLRARQASGREGPLTQEEIQLATMAGTREDRREMLLRLRERLDSAVDPDRRFNVATMLEAFEADDADLRALEGPVSEEQLREVTDRLVARSKEMMEKMLAHRRGRLSRSCSTFMDCGPLGPLSTDPFRGRGGTAQSERETGRKAFGVRRPDIALVCPRRPNGP